MLQFFCNQPVMHIRLLTVIVPSLRTYEPYRSLIRFDSNEPTRHIGTIHDRGRSFDALHFRNGLSLLQLTHSLTYDGEGFEQLRYRKSSRHSACIVDVRFCPSLSLSASLAAYPPAFAIGCCARNEACCFFLPVRPEWSDTVSDGRGTAGRGEQPAANGHGTRRRVFGFSFSCFWRDETRREDWQCANCQLWKRKEPLLGRVWAVQRQGFGR